MCLQNKLPLIPFEVRDVFALTSASTIIKPTYQSVLINVKDVPCPLVS